MFTKRGQPFRCSIPEIPPEVDNDHLLENLSAESIQTVLKSTTLQQAFTKDCVQLVRTQPFECCFGRIIHKFSVQVIPNAWWQYEYCFSKKVIQFHYTDRGTPEPIIDLGVFSHNFDWSSINKKVSAVTSMRCFLFFIVISDFPQCSVPEQIFFKDSHKTFWSFVYLNTC